MTTIRWTLLGLLLFGLVGCPAGRRGGGGGGGGDDDDSAADDGDDDDVNTDASLGGTYQFEYDLGPGFEEAGFWDCTAERNIVDVGGDPLSGCPGDVAFVVDLVWSNSDCNEEMFADLDPIEELSMGFGDGHYYEAWDGDWYDFMTGNQTGDVESGGFTGTSDWIEMDGYEARLHLDAWWY